MNTSNNIFKEYNEFKVVPHKIIKKQRTDTQYVNLVNSFDIETTSTIVKGQKVAFMYLWGVSINSTDFYYGRTWDEFKYFIDMMILEYGINLKKRLVFYVHNLAYEFQFMSKIFDWVDTFSLSERKPIKAVTRDGVEFRCSYLLSGYSLEKVAENLRNTKIEKLSGYDYKLIRHQETPITLLEFKYLKNDVKIVTDYIYEEVEIYGDLVKIPMTNTSKVRRYVRSICYTKGNYSKYRRIMKNLTLEPSEYPQLKRAFQGGFVHSNMEQTGKVLNNVSSIDFTSSYPSVMVAEKFPMSRGEKIIFTKEKGFDYWSKNHCLLMDVEIHNLEVKEEIPDSYLSVSKCYNVKNGVINNGRVFSADSLITTITDIDFTILRNVYNWEQYGVKNIVAYKKGYLPKAIIQAILKLYGDKTTLKGVQGKEVEYLLSKGMLNSIYGMCVTDIVQDSVLYTDEKWTTEKPNLEEEIEIYNDKTSRFLYYPWGVWVTAYARRNLWMGIKYIGDDYIYSDTDSIKLTNYDNHTKFLKWYDTSIIKKMEKLCSYHNLDPKLICPKNSKGIECFLGVWDFEGTSEKFKTLGAKRYLGLKNGKYSLTVAGLSKSNGMDYIKKTYSDPFQGFNNNLFIPSNETGKMTHTYIDDENEFYIIDYTGIETFVNVPSGIHLSDCDFTLEQSNEYIKFLQNIVNGQQTKEVQEL
ncbi:MAG: DNA polymerase [Cetobacterium sp.]